MSFKEAAKATNFNTKPETQQRNRVHRSGSNKDLRGAYVGLDHAILTSPTSLYAPETPGDVAKWAEQRADRELLPHDDFVYELEA